MRALTPLAREAYLVQIRRGHFLPLDLPELLHCHLQRLIDPPLQRSELHHRRATRTELRERDVKRDAIQQPVLLSQLIVEPIVDDLGE